MVFLSVELINRFAALQVEDDKDADITWEGIKSAYRDSASLCWEKTERLDKRGHHQNNIMQKEGHTKINKNSWTIRGIISNCRESSETDVLKRLERACEQSYT